LYESRHGLIADNETTLAEEFDMLRSTADPSAMIFLAIAQWHMRDFQACLSTLDQLEAVSLELDSLLKVKAISGWVCLAQARFGQGSAESDTDDDDAEFDNSLGDAASHFDSLLDKNAASIEVRLHQRVKR
jgi:hypothetical protein